MAQHKIKKAVFRIGAEVVGVIDAQKETLHYVENLKCVLAIEYNVSLDEVEVEYKEELYELGDTFVTDTGKLCQYDHLWTPQQIENIHWGSWVNPNSEEGANTILDYIKMGIVDELIIFQ